MFRCVNRHILEVFPSVVIVSVMAVLRVVSLSLKCCVYMSQQRVWDYREWMMCIGIPEGRPGSEVTVEALHGDLGEVYIHVRISVHTDYICGGGTDQNTYRVLFRSSGDNQYHSVSTNHNMTSIWLLWVSKVSLSSRTNGTIFPDIYIYISVLHIL